MQNACENTSDVKKRFPRRPFSAQSAKTTIFWAAQDGNALPKVMVLKPFWAWKRRLAHDVCKIRLSEMCLLPWRGAHFHKFYKNLKKNHAKKHQKTKKFNKIRDIAKMKRKSWVQNGPKRQKCPGPTREQHFYWPKRARRRGIERANAPKSGSKLPFLKALCWESFFKNVLPTEGGEHIFEKRWEKLKQNRNASKNACCSLHFWCKLLTRSTGHSFLSARSAAAIVFLKITKSAPRSFWGGPAECAGALGEIMRGFWDLQDVICKFGLLLWIWHASSCLTARAADQALCAFRRA